MSICFVASEGFLVAVFPIEIDGLREVHPGGGIGVQLKCASRQLVTFIYSIQDRQVPADISQHFHVIWVQS